MTDATRESKQLRAGAGVRGIERRLFLRQGLSLGALTLLTGCDVTDTSAVQSVLNGISSWNDRAQAALFNPRRLMPTYPESAAVKDFRWNAYFTQDLIPKIDGASFKLNLSGLIDSRRPWTLQELYALPQQSQVTRHVCVEGWSMIGKWTGVPFRTFLAHRRRRPRNMSGSNAPTATTPRSTWPRRCIRRPCSPSRSPTRSWRRNTAIRSAARRHQARPRIRNGSAALRDQPVSRRVLGGSRLQLVRRGVNRVLWILQVI